MLELHLRFNENNVVEMGGSMMSMKKELIAYHLSKLVNGLLDESPHHYSSPATPSQGWPSVPLQPNDCSRGNAWAQKWMTASKEFGAGMSISPEEGWFLYGLVRAAHPKVVLECGTHKGWSTMFLAAAVRDNGLGHVTSLDIKDYGAGLRLAARGLGQEWLDCRVQDELTYTPPKPIEFLFHDADHGAAAIAKSLAHFQPHLAPGAILCIDDTRLKPDQRPILEHWMKTSGSTGIPFPVPTGLWVMRYQQSQFEGERIFVRHDMLDSLIG